MPLSKIHSTLTSDHILLDGTDSTGANANSSVLLDSSAANTDVGSLMSYEAGADDGSALLTNTHLADMVSPVRSAGRTITIPDVSEPIRTDDDSNIQQFQGHQTLFQAQVVYNKHTLFGGKWMVVVKETKIVRMGL